VTQPLPRESHIFPTRNYPYRYPRIEDGLEADEPEIPPLEAGKLYSFVLGLDPTPRIMPADEIDTSLRDPFATLLLKRGNFPMTLRELLSALDAVSNEPDGLPEQKCFFAADGGQIGWTPETAAANRLFRFVIVRSRGGDVRLMISASTVIDSPTQFIQLIAWDPSNAAYNFYERRGGTWLWAGNSRHALAPGTRGEGPFDSHVNGSMVMKELRQPWCNWHSMSASIQSNVLAPNDPLHTEPLFINRVSAHELENGVVRPGIERWNRARLQAAISADGTLLTDVPYFLRQVLEATTVNLASSSQPSEQVTHEGTLTLPTTFFLNVEALLDYIGLAPQIAPVRVPGRFYLESLERYEFRLTDGSFSQRGDTFFAFLVPEPAFEDLNVLWLLLRERIISKRFAACLLMVDFHNPVFSRPRKSLMDYVPETARLFAAVTGDQQVKSDLQDQIVAAIEAKEPNLAADSPEMHFLANWRLPEADWKRTFEARIEAYFNNLHQMASTEEGFDGWVRLAESRRREFRRHPLAEFRLTTPTTNISATARNLVMQDDGSVKVAARADTG
jgi:hypothetical protein